MEINNGHDLPTPQSGLPSRCINWSAENINPQPLYISDSRVPPSPFPSPPIPGERAGVGSLRPDIRLNPGAAIATLLTDPAVVLMDLDMLCIELVAVKIMPVANPTVASQVFRLGICFGLPAAFPLGIFDGHPPLSKISILPLPGYTAGPGRAPAGSGVLLRSGVSCAGSYPGSAARTRSGL